MKSIIDFFNRENLSVPDIGILDIGAMLIKGQKKEYQSLLDAGITKVIGFEPVAQECERLNNEMQSENMRFLPYFIGDGRLQTFCLNKSSMTSSLYEANHELRKLFHGLSELAVTIDREEVQTTRLDDIPEIDFPIDYIKIDIQEAELQAFEGSRNLLKNTTVIQTEVIWVPLYKNQPLFSEVELCLREQEFFLHKIMGYGTRAFKPFIFNNNTNVGIQQLWSDAIFIKDFTRIDKLSERQLSVCSILMHEIYKSIDLAGHILSELGKRVGKTLGESYQQWVLADIGDLR